MSAQFLPALRGGALALLLAGGMVLVLDQGRTGGGQLWGLLALAFGEPLPSASAALALFAIGATGYGLSLRFYCWRNGPLARRAGARTRPPPRRRTSRACTHGHSNWRAQPSTSA